MFCNLNTSYSSQFTSSSRPNGRKYLCLKDRTDSRPSCDADWLVWRSSWPCSGHSWCSSWCSSSHSYCSLAWCSTSWAGPDDQRTEIFPYWATALHWSGKLTIEWGSKLPVSQQLPIITSDQARSSHGRKYFSFSLTQISQLDKSQPFKVISFVYLQHQNELGLVDVLIYWAPIDPSVVQIQMCQGLTSVLINVLRHLNYPEILGQILSTTELFLLAQLIFLMDGTNAPPRFNFLTIRAVIIVNINYYHNNICRRVNNNNLVLRYMFVNASTSSQTNYRSTKVLFTVLMIKTWRDIFLTNISLCSPD